MLQLIQILNNPTFNDIYWQYNDLKSIYINTDNIVSIQQDLDGTVDGEHVYYITMINNVRYYILETQYNILILKPTTIQQFNRIQKLQYD